MGRRKKNSRKPSGIIQKSCEKMAPENSSEKETPRPEEKYLAPCEVTIDVYSRLKLPLVHRQTNDEEEVDEEEDTVELSFCPRFVFVSSLCLVCMERSANICESCRMVSYCGDRHRQLDWPRHRDLCAVFSDVCTAEGEGLSLLPKLTADEYRVYRLKLIEMTSRRLARPLELWEREILLYPRVCRQCRRFSTTLRCCGTCGVELFCEHHENEHERWCREFRVFARVLLMQHANGHVDPAMPDAPPRKDPLYLPNNNFDSLMARLYRYSMQYYRDMDCYTYCVLSHVSTVPLTTLYSAQISRQDWQVADTLVVHVIGAEFQFECVNLHAWEALFLHLLPNLKHLRLMFIGPELRLPSVPLNLLATVKLCAACKLSGRRVNVSFHPGKFYHVFRHSEQFVKPHLVCLFNPGLYRKTGFDGRDTWPETIGEFCKARVPVCVTSYTKHEIPREMIRIKSISDVETILEPRRNPFASIKPDRNFVSDDTAPLIYKNYYVAIVKGK